jgi:tRNA-2-methylthio-N6-dimethylallyladenosine synthase
MPNQVSDEVVGERYTRLHEHQQAISLSVNQEAMGSTHRVMVSEIEGRRDSAQSRMTGRSEDFRLVHFADTTDARPGDFVDVEITESSAHYLIGESRTVTRTRGGDAHEARVAQVEATRATNLGMPQVRV